MSGRAESAYAQLKAISQNWNPPSKETIVSQVSGILSGLTDSEVMEVARKLVGKAGRNRTSAAAYIQTECLRIYWAKQSQRV